MLAVAKRRNQRCGESTRFWSIRVNLPSRSRTRWITNITSGRPASYSSKTSAIGRCSAHGTMPSWNSVTCLPVAQHDGVLADQVEAADVAVEVDAHARPVEARRDLLDVASTCRCRAVPGRGRAGRARSRRGSRAWCRAGSGRRHRSRARARRARRRPARRDRNRCRRSRARRPGASPVSPAPPASATCEGSGRHASTCCGRARRLRRRSDAERLGGATQHRQQRARLRRREPHDRRLDRDAQVGAPPGGGHRHREAEQAGQELLVVDREAVALHALQLALELGQIDQRVRGEALERRMREQALPLRRRHLGEKGLAARRAVHRHARAGMQIEAQRRRGLDAVEIDDLAAGERRDVAALADLLDEVAQHGMAGAVVAVVHQQVFGEAAQAHVRCCSGGRRPRAAAGWRPRAAAACGAASASAGRSPRPAPAARTAGPSRRSPRAARTGAGSACRRRARPARASDSVNDLHGRAMLASFRYSVQHVPFSEDAG